MRILIAEDDSFSRSALRASLIKWGHEVVVTSNGVEAWEALQREDAPLLAILDWMMPGMDGIEVCRMVRQRTTPIPIYIILLTAKSGQENIIGGLEAGADDYVTKPVNRDELRVRVQAGVRIVELQRALSERVRELEDALARVRQLSDKIIPAKGPNQAQ